MKFVLGKRPVVERVQIVVRAVAGTRQVKTVSLPVWRRDGTPPPFNTVLAAVKRAILGARL